MTDNTIAVLPRDGIGPEAGGTALEVITIEHQTIVYARRPARDLKIDLCRPAGDVDAWPVVVWVHGGGFHRGDRTQTPDQLEDFRALGLAVASIGYRLRHEAHVPASSTTSGPPSATCAAMPGSSAWIPGPSVCGAPRPAAPLPPLTACSETRNRFPGKRTSPAT